MCCRCWCSCSGFIVVVDVFVNLRVSRIRLPARADRIPAPHGGADRAADHRYLRLSTLQLPRRRRAHRRDGIHLRDGCGGGLLRCSPAASRCSRSRPFLVVALLVTGADRQYGGRRPVDGPYAHAASATAATDPSGPPPPAFARRRDASVFGGAAHRRRAALIAPADLRA